MPDLILLHAPSVYDFRKKTILYGPVSDLIPSTTAFEMYPIGFASMVDYLTRAGYNVRILNLAVRMLNNKNFDVEATINKLESPLFGIDLHWLLHSHGAIEIARIVKKYHPHSKVLFGGLSSSYFFKDLMTYEEIDYVLRGDSTEEPLRQLVAAVKEGKEPENVPNLVWKDEKGQVRENPFNNVPEALTTVFKDYYANMVRSVIKYRDLASYLPFKNWRTYPITAVLTCRGCTKSCVICGGSSSAFRNFYNRSAPAYRPPEAVIADVKQIDRFSGGPIFILGDLRQPGEDYADKVFTGLKNAGVKNQIILELFTPASKELLQKMADTCPNFCLEISPESHDTDIIKASGRGYTREGLEQTIADALAVGCGRVDIYFMIGIPKQTYQSVMETIEFCEYLYKKHNGDKRLALFIAPLSPFLDPGSLGFENPEKFGYKRFYSTLEEHRQALLSPNWKYALNYETEWLTRQQIVDVSYEAILRLNSLKLKYGIISPEMAAVSDERLKSAREMAHYLEELMTRGNSEMELARLKPQIDTINAFPVAERIQQELPGKVGLKWFKALGMWFKR
ncbi:MAG: TIGR04190 family B12-binding domain/radical SAM domain protein [Dehalococcoidales bacterium]|nr:TIGR04190 family B12-binding domain/radical SAM domain protein [Dehalococcoidales bacterium]